MSKTVSIELFQYEELDDAGKAKARDWYRDASDGDNEFAEFVIEDAVRMAGFMGIEVDTHEVTLMNGKKRHDPSVWWSLGYCQSDFAAFDGSYKHAPDAAAAIAEETGTSEPRLIALAERLEALQAAFDGKLTARIKHSDYYGLQVEAEALDADDEPMDIAAEQETELKEIFRAFCQWIYDSLRQEHEYQSADEQVADTIVANEYWFEADGKRAD